jgi:glycosyltransferase involved in cell wall biosynthesis
VHYSVFTNGVDDVFLSTVDNSVARGDEPYLQIVYAGNIGAGQGLHHIVPELAVRLKNKVKFKIIGDGGALDELKAALRERGVETEVELCLPVPRSDLVGIYQQADILFLHLNSYSSLKRVLPSKLFEYAAMGKPIWAGLDGYSADFVLEHIDNAAVFSPCNADQALSALASLTMDCHPRTGFRQHYARNTTMRAMVEDVVLTASDH